MKKTNNLIFTGLQIVAWIIFIGLCIEAGGLLVNFVFSIYNPDMISRLYNKLNLMAMYQQSAFAFYAVYSFILIIAILKAILFYLVIILLLRLDLAKPFSDFVAKQIMLISYYTLVIGLLSYMARHYAGNLQHQGIETAVLNTYWADSQAFILMAAVVYIIATIFKTGITIQNENDLTV
ncbi:MAG: DUF2975 domain-containing protein [Bacteroidia bacterium]|nr:DUF2975 domain-containing protein [Bacteroidia bacterium]